MKTSSNTLFADYLRGCIRGRSGAIDGLSLPDLYKAFATLPPPAVGFDEWCTAIGAGESGTGFQPVKENAEDTGKMPVPQTAEPTPEDIDEQNRQALATLKLMQLRGAPITVTGPEDSKAEG